MARRDCVGVGIPDSMSMCPLLLLLFYQLGFLDGKPYIYAYTIKQLFFFDFMN